MGTIEQLLSQLESDKDTLVTNLNSKGVTANNSETFTSLVPKVLNITSEGILPDKTIQSGDYEYIETMEISPSNDIGFHVISAPTTKSVFFETGAGYEMNVNNDDMVTYLGLTPEMLVSGNTILGVEGAATSFDTSDANATSEQILEGYTAYVKGKKIEGEILKKSESTIVPGTIDITISRGLYMDGTQTIKGDEALVSDNIKAGVTIFNVSGKDTVVDTEIDPELEATPSEILSNKKAFVNGAEITGIVKPISANGQVIQTAEIDYLKESQNIGLSVTYNEPKLIKSNDKIVFQTSKEELAETIELSSDIILEGNTILGVEGTAVSGYSKEEIQNLLNTKVDKVTGKGLSSNDFTDAYKDKLGNLENYDDTAIIAETALNRSTLGYQRKNLLRNNCKSVTMNGVTATVNADGSVTLSGSNTVGKAFVLFGNICTGLENQFENNAKFLPNGQYIVSGGSSGCFIQITISPDNTAATTIVLCRAAENDVLFNITDNHKYVWGRIVVDTGADFSSPVTLYPMVRDANIADNTYEPYSKSSLDERVSSLEGSIEKLGGAASETAIIAQTLGYSKKNILKCDAEPKTLGGITFTVSNDLVNAAGTATGGFTYYYAQPAAPYSFDKDVIITYTGSISGCIAAVKTGEAGAYEYKNISANAYKIAKGTKIVQIYLQCSTAGTSVNITDFGVMIRDADITDDTYEPYKPSVEERLAALEEKLAALEGGDT